MFFTYTSRAGFDGIHAQPEHLSPLGITADAQVWGLAIEGREVDKHCRLDRSTRRCRDAEGGFGTDTEWLNKQTPHMALSPLHHSTWPTAFTVQALLQRRLPDSHDSPTSWDSFHGICDALKRLGVNILWIRTSQIGYDLVAFTATCEFPHLRVAAQPLVAEADRAGGIMTAARHEIRTAGMSRKKETRVLLAATEQAESIRLEAFAKLGKLMIPRLAELESRLLAMEDYRFSYSEALAVERGVKRGHVGASTKEHLARADSDFVYELVVGVRPPEGLSRPARHEQFREAIARAWFLNNKVVEAGENTYFLSYDNFCDRDTIRHLRKAVDGRKRPLMSTAEMSDASLDKLHSSALDILQKRKVEGSLKDMLRQCESAKRVAGIHNGDQYEVYSIQDFFRRQALLPLKVSALPSLAHARFWALGSLRQAADAAPQPFAVRFRYRDGTLEPVDVPYSHDGKIAKVYEFLNEITRLSKPVRRSRSRRAQPFAADSLGVFGPHSAVTCNVYGEDRFMRLRFFRATVETATYCTVRAPYAIRRTTAIAPGDGHPENKEAGPTFSAMGMLRHVSELMLSKGFQIEGMFNKITEVTDTTEAGYAELTLHVTAVGSHDNAAPRSQADIVAPQTDAAIWAHHFPEDRSERKGAAILAWLDQVGFTTRATPIDEDDAELVVERVGRAWSAQLRKRWDPGCEWTPMPFEFRRGFAPVIR